MKISTQVLTQQQSLTDLVAVQALTKHMTKSALVQLEKALADMSGHGLTAYDLWLLLNKEINIE